MDRGRTPLVLVTVAPSETPRSSSACSLLRTLNRRLVGRRGTPISRSSSTDSDDPSSPQQAPRRRPLRSASSPSGSSDSSSSLPSAESALRKALHTLTLSSTSSSRSQSASPPGDKQSRRGSLPGPSKKSPKRILRSPVAYTYVRGLSGLPTQRVPRASTCPGSGSTPSCCRKAAGSAASGGSRLVQLPGLNR